MRFKIYLYNKNKTFMNLQRFEHQLLGHHQKLLSDDDGDSPHVLLHSDVWMSALMNAWMNDYSKIFVSLFTLQGVAQLLTKLLHDGISLLLNHNAYVLKLHVYAQILNTEHLPLLSLPLELTHLILPLHPSSIHPLRLSFLHELLRYHSNLLCPISLSDLLQLSQLLGPP